MTHSASSSAIRDPPISTIRRTSRRTYAYSWLARSAIDPLRTRTSPSVDRRERSRARVAFVSAVRSAATICASSSAARASSAAVSETDPVGGVDGEEVSSTVVRAALVAGDLARTARLLGRGYGLRGRVVVGDQRGRQLGFPTANLHVPGGVMLELAQGMARKLDSSYVLALGVADVRAAARALEAAGVAPSMPPTEVMPGVTMLFVQDPDGRTIELVEFASGALTSFANLGERGEA